MGSESSAVVFAVERPRRELRGLPPPCTPLPASERRSSAATPGEVLEYMAKDGEGSACDSEGLSPAQAQWKKVDLRSGRCLLLLGRSLC